MYYFKLFQFLVLLRLKTSVENRKCFEEPIISMSTKNQTVMLNKETPHSSNLQKIDTEENDTVAQNSSALLDKGVQADTKCYPQKKKQTEREEKPKNSIRFDGYRHYLDFDDPNEERKGYRCKNCGRQTNTFCTKCSVHLCFVRERAKKGEKKIVRNCFRNYHEINES